jgi:hypothetical protein
MTGSRACRHCEFAQSGRAGSIRRDSEHERPGGGGQSKLIRLPTTDLRKVRGVHWSGAGSLRRSCLAAAELLWQLMRSLMLRIGGPVCSHTRISASASLFQGVLAYVLIATFSNLCLTR